MQFAGVEIHLVAELFVTLGKLNDAVGIRIRKRTKKDAVNDSEDGAVGADAESERQNGNQCESWRFGENAEAVAEVLASPRFTANSC